MIYLLDTNICIYVINNKPAHVFEKFKQYQLGQLVISSISASELAFGVEKSGSLRNKNALDKFLAPLDILPYDENAIWHYAKLRQTLHAKGQPIGSLDMLIAAHALALDTVLVTNNMKEFERIEGLKLENWI
ncbi:type II toxin-antitoxin system VapC family toxin [Acinetobacter bereziniae]|uniref:type II toxin-antitoxin system tRNA(fMet)-specific endonuclease VapC n=1 Tax=Acinetobacter bereziniae TaxID=106648 RepID=UPI0011172450|nr:type II toxin-antitoxin system VapC family toxin [Acinetobacter bereziniae]MBJ9904869.1 type II toxin-antitoxin system VapC family toxin [Acinetobacter bereziniae]MBJ9951314.1 type II toxin-antitoxin system VapC family toxin [Acinetobacter bereziniae]MCU4320543.1 type II toxin-antitoxin system VapC family toxin [Acinetobacter bereziniae]MCU4599296.1 type II toxin-antitoxin system VapC family toxin [Acinetobacter bereziniae]MDQ9818052.1 type II toxin-antitoxin system VapC family toxin [Acine